MHERIVTDSFRRAAVEYLFLVERDYARASALKLVGDRYQLDSTQRSMLYRGIASTREVALREGKLTQDVSRRRLAIDGLNVLYTIANYLYGRVLFICLDGLLRDAAEVHGANLGPPRKRDEILDSAISFLMEWLSSRMPSEVLFYLDEPVSLSGRLAARLRRELHSAELSGTATTVRSADFALKQLDDAIVATSDSTIIESSRCSVCDVARHVLVQRFSPEFVDLREVVRES